MRRRLAIGGLLLGILAAIDAFLVEPRLVRPCGVELAAAGPPLRLALFADLHLDRFSPQAQRALAIVEAWDPAAVLVAGDFIANTENLAERRKFIAAARQFVAAAGARRPIYAVQGHSDYDGRLIEALAGAGITWLDNETVTLRPGTARVDLAGVNQQAGEDAGEAYRVFSVAGAAGGPARVRAGPLPLRNYYATCCGAGANDWRDYEVRAAVAISDPAAGIGIGVYSGAAEGRDRMYRVRRAGGFTPAEEYFALASQGSSCEAGRTTTPILPVPGVWYRLALRAETLSDRTRVRAKVWEEGRAEPAAWQVDAEDLDPLRLHSGAVSLWAWGAGEHLWRDLEMRRLADSESLAPMPLVLGSGGPGGPGSVLAAPWTQGSRLSRLELALERRPPGQATTTILLTHSPDVALEAARRGLPIVLAGHTHGGQVRLPFFGALTTRTKLGRHYDRGVFRIPGSETRLVIDAGLGTSWLPVRFFDPPSVTLIEIRPRS